MTEFNERDGGATPVYGENGADVAKAKAMILHLLRADSGAQAERRLRRLCSTVVQRDWIEPAFLAVQECRDLGILGSLEATFLLDTLYRAVRGQYSTTGDGRMTPEQAFMIARGEDAAAMALRWSPREYDWRCSSGALLIMERRAVPEMWGDEEPDPREVLVISKYLAAFAGSETPLDRKAAANVVEGAILLTQSIDAVAAIQSMREVGMITFAQSLAFSFMAVRGRRNEALATDRENARRHLGQRDPDGTFSDRRSELLLAATYRRVGEHRAANMLRKTPAEFDRLIASAFDTSDTSLTSDVGSPNTDVRDVPVIGMLQSKAVRRAKKDILRVVHAPSTAAAKRHLCRLTERVAVAEADASAAVTAVQELHDIDLIDDAEFHYLLDRLANAWATGSTIREPADDNERARAAELLDARGEQAIAGMVREEAGEHAVRCSTGCKTLMESRLAPDCHLDGASDPVAVARIAAKLAVWWRPECGEWEVRELAGPEWDDVFSAAEGATAASAVAAANESVRAGTLSSMGGAWAIEGLLDLQVARAMVVDRAVSRSAHSITTMLAAREYRDPDVSIDARRAVLQLVDESRARKDRLRAAALRRFGEHIAASMWVEEVGKRGY
jgi:hypothetical protein